MNVQQTMEDVMNLEFVQIHKEVLIVNVKMDTKEMDLIVMY